MSPPADRSGVPTGSVVTEARALRTDELPRAIIRRHDEMNALASALDPAVDGLRPEPTIIHGPSGAGKTAVARRGIEKLKSEVLNISSAYVEGWARSSAAVLRRVVDNVSRAPVHGTEGRQRLRDRLRDHDDHIVVILDEVDQLAEFSVLHDLYECPTTTIVGTATRLEPLIARVDSRIQSRVRSAVHIRFSSYSDDDLTAILEDRADWGLAPAAVDRQTLRYIATEADGDARRAISILRCSAREADRRGLVTVSRACVDDTLEDAERAVRASSLQKLSTEHRRLYECLSGAGEIPVDEVYERYRERAAVDRSDRYIRGLRQKLVDYGLLEAVGPKTNRRYVALEP